MKKNSIKFISFIAIYLLLNSFIFIYFKNDKNSKTDIYLNQKIKKLTSEYKATKNSFNLLTNFVAENISLQKDISKLILNLKNGKNPKETRKKLYNRLLEFYNLLKKYKIYYMTLYFPDGKVFLRMHQPYRYGDNLYHKNKMDFINSSFKISEIETGIIYNYPIFYEKNLIANIKMSISFNILKQELTKLFNSDYEYILKKDFISSPSLKIGQKLFIQSDINKNFFYEESSIKRDRSRVTNETIHKINMKLKRRIEKKLTLENSFSEALKIGDNYYVVTFLTISPAKNYQNVGYLISYEKDNTFEVFENTFLHNIILGNIILILILSFVYYVLKINEKLKLLASIDKLTGLFNRNRFYEISKSEIERAKRYNRPLSLIIFDIDFFKKINDKFGHNTGDYILKKLSEIVKKNIRKSDFLFRWGGEEFIIFSPETDIDGAKILAEKIREAVENFKFDKVENVTISLGVAQFNESKDKNIDMLIHRADEALYESKKSGRNRATIAN